MYVRGRVSSVHVFHLFLFFLSLSLSLSLLVVTLVIFIFILMERAVRMSTQLLSENDAA